MCRLCSNAKFIHSVWQCYNALAANDDTGSTSCTCLFTLLISTFNLVTTCPLYLSPFISMYGLMLQKHLQLKHSHQCFFFFSDSRCLSVCHHWGTPKVLISRLASRTPVWLILKIVALFLPVSHSHSYTCAPSDIPQLQCYLHPNQVSIRWMCLCCVFFCWNWVCLFVELQSFWVWMHSKFPALVITGSWAPLHILHVGFSEYLTFFLAIRPSTSSIIVGIFVSI